MIAKQYTIKLPADYDMGIIRQRVRDRGGAFDEFPGLALKAFLITEIANGAAANSYAPFYLWRDLSGANEFIYGDGLAGVSSSFGRPLIEHWIGLEHRPGDRQRVPRFATREDHLVPEEGLPAVREREREWTSTMTAGEGGVYAAAVALDPYRWQLVRFALWCEQPPKPVNARTTYEVLHLSNPGLR